ncbi:MAG: SDR family oxidoreductase [Rhodospirillaceae bacterium]
MQRMADAEEIAQAALFLLSGRAAFVTGSAMLADGGVSIRLG